MVEDNVPPRDTGKSDATASSHAVFVLTDTGDRFVDSAKSKAAKSVCFIGEDPVGQFMSRKVRCFVYFSFCMGTQAFMSYDGGATPASVPRLKEMALESSLKCKQEKLDEYGISESDSDAVDGQAKIDIANCMNQVWTDPEVGLLGSMPYFAMGTAIIWGKLLERYPAKLLLTIGLTMNTLATGVFALTTEKSAMLACKFCMGASQALQGVWATVWTINNAPPDLKTLWLSLGGVSAGVGSALGTLVAGFFVNWMYGFAFLLQAGVLGLFGVALLLTPAAKLSTRLTPEIQALQREQGKSVVSTASGVTGDVGANRALEDESMGMVTQMRTLIFNPVYFWTVFCLAWGFYLQNGVQYYWPSLFTHQMTWNIPDALSGVGMIVVLGIGGGVGMAGLAPMCEKKGGYDSKPGQLRTLMFHNRSMQFCTLAGIMCCVFLYAKTVVQYGELWNAGRKQGATLLTDVQKKQCESGTVDYWMFFVWACLFAMWVSHQGAVPQLVGVNLLVVPPNLRELASGFEMTVRNMVGFAMGPLIPSVFMTFVANLYQMNDIGTTPVPTDLDEASRKQFLDDQQCLADASDARKLYYGFAFLTVSNGLILFFFHRACAPAQVISDEVQKKALDDVRAALAIEAGRDISQMERQLKDIDRAINAAKKAELQHNMAYSGESVLGYINEVRGKLCVEIEKRKRGNNLTSADSVGSLDSRESDATKCEDGLKPEDVATEDDFNRLLEDRETKISQFKSENECLQAEVSKIRNRESEAAKLRQELKALEAIVNDYQKSLK